MKKILLASLIILAGFSVNAQTNAKVAAKPAATKKPVTTASKMTVKPAFKTNLDSASYALGVNVASSFKSGGLSAINYELFNKGLKDVFANAMPLLSQEKCQETINKLFESYSKQRETMSKQNEAAEKQKYAANVNEGANFLAQNKMKTGVKATTSGLQYEVIHLGEGAKPKANDVVTVHYKGTLLNGTQFDSSYDRNEPATFGLNQVIPGWTEGVQLMPVGSKFRFFIPYQLAYGSRGTPDGSIPPFSALIFEVELLKIGQ